MYCDSYPHRLIKEADSNRFSSLERPAVIEGHPIGLNFYTSLTDVLVRLLDLTSIWMIIMTFAAKSVVRLDEAQMMMRWMTKWIHPFICTAGRPLYATPFREKFYLRLIPLVRPSPLGFVRLPVLQILTWFASFSVGSGWMNFTFLEVGLNYVGISADGYIRLLPYFFLSMTIYHVGDWPPQFPSLVSLSLFFFFF